MSKNKEILIFILLVCLLSLLSLWRSFFFHFWRDDWIQIWSAVYQPNLLFDRIPTINWHPILIYEQIFLVKFFKLNPFWWQITGWFLKIIDSIAVSVMVFGFTNSRKAALFAGLVFAASVGGIESMTFASAHTSALIIPFICLGLYFWVLSDTTKNLQYLFLSLILLFISIWGDPGRGILVIALAAIWNLLTLAQNLNKKGFLSFVKRTLFILLLMIFIRPIVGSKGTIMITQITDNLIFIKEHPLLAIARILDPLGNLLAGWVIPIKEFGGLSSFNYFSVLVGLFLWFMTIWFAIFFIVKRSDYFKVVLIFCIWITIFFIPNWIVGKDLVIGGIIVGATHRYLTLSSVGLAVLIGTVLSKVKKRGFRLALLFGVIFLNIVSANRILHQENQFRDVTVVNRLWDQIDREVIQRERDLVFIYTGEGYLERSALAWSLSIPFGIKRGYNHIEDFPLVVNDWEILVKLVCGEPVDRSILGGSLRSNAVPLSRIYIWNVSNGELTNISEIVRKEISEKVNCY